MRNALKTTNLLPGPQNTHKVVAYMPIMLGLMVINMRAGRSMYRLIASLIVLCSLGPLI